MLPSRITQVSDLCPERGVLRGYRQGLVVISSRSRQIAIEPFERSESAPPVGCAGGAEIAGFQPLTRLVAIALRKIGLAHPGRDFPARSPSCQSGSQLPLGKIGRASCRESVCQYV